MATKTVEQYLTELCNFEDPDSVLQLCTTESDGVYIASNDGSLEVEAPTLIEALQKFQELEQSRALRNIRNK